MPNSFDNNDLDNIFNESGSDGSNENQVEDTPEIKPVKLSKKATAGIIIAGIVVIIIILITIRGCTLEKKVNTTPNTGSTIQATEELTQTTEKQVETSPKISENSSVSQEVVTTPSENNNSSNLTSSNIENNKTSVDSSNTLNEVALPAFGNPFETKGIVISKHTYKYQGSYIYGVSISMLVGDNTQTVYYFCPKNTYDALSSTDTVNVTYQQDSGGVISITSISK